MTGLNKAISIEYSTISDIKNLMNLIKSNYKNKTTNCFPAKNQPISKKLNKGNLKVINQLESSSMEKEDRKSRDA